MEKIILRGLGGPEEIGLEVRRNDYGNCVELIVDVGPSRNVMTLFPNSSVTELKWELLELAEKIPA